MRHCHNSTGLDFSGSVPRALASAERRIDQRFGLDLAALHLQQPALALYAPAIPSQLAIGRNCPMARHNYGQRVGAACRTDGAHSLRRADRLRDLSIAAGLAARNFAQRLPHAMLKRGRPHIEGQGSGRPALRHLRRARTALPHQDLRHRAAAWLSQTSRANSRSASSSESAKSTAQSPRAVAATSTRPSGDSAVVQRIVSPAPPAFITEGRIPSVAPALSYTRLADPKPAAYIASVIARGAILQMSYETARASARAQTQTA